MTASRTDAWRRPDRTRSRPRGGRSERLGVGALAGLASAVYATLALLDHARFRTSTYDLVIFDQAVRAYSRWELPRSPVKGVHDGFGADFVLLGDHFSPVWALLAPAYWVWDDPRVLLVAQALLLGGSVVPVWFAARRRLGSAAAAYATAGAYALAWGLQETVGFDVHEVAFAVPLIAVAIERAWAGRFAPATAAVLALLLVKEDLGALVVAFGVWFAVLGRWRLGVAVAAAGAVGFLVTVELLVPLAAGGRDYAYWSYGALGPDLPSLVGAVVRDPLGALRLAVTPSEKVRLLIWVLLPTAGLALLSPLLLLALPLLAERLLSGREVLWTTAFHYTAPLVPVLALAAVDGLARLPLSRRTTHRVALAWLVVAAVLTFDRPLGDLARADSWSVDARVSAARAAVARIPDGALVAASNNLGPHLSARTRVLLLDGQRLDVDWVVADTTRIQWPFRSTDELRTEVERLRAAGWTTVSDAAGIVLLQRA